jgi:predicted TIM-barrel enzyme
MASPTDRQQILAMLNKCIDENRSIIGAGAGIGLSAKSIEAGGGDLIILYNSGRYRMNGLGSLAGLMPYGNANDIVLQMAKETLPLLKRTPLLAGVCATDPTRPLGPFLEELKALGVAGIQNFPTVGLIDADSVFRRNLEETGMGFDKEVEMIRHAHSLDMLTTPYAFNAEEARQMAEAGADIIVAHMGLTTSGTIGAQTTGLSLKECVRAVQDISDAARDVQRPGQDKCIVLCHGGPIATVADAEYILSSTSGVHGFYGASSIERLPVELAITETVSKFKSIQRR